MCQRWGTCLDDAYGAPGVCQQLPMNIRDAEVAAAMQHANAHPVPGGSAFAKPPGPSQPPPRQSVDDGGDGDDDDDDADGSKGGGKAAGRRYLAELYAEGQPAFWDQNCSSTLEILRMPRVTVANLCPASCRSCTCADGSVVYGADGQCTALTERHTHSAQLLGCLQHAEVVKWHGAKIQWQYGPQFVGNRTVPTDWPCRRACTACDLGPVCQSLLLAPIQQWTQDWTLNWLLDSSGIASPELAAAFVAGSIDGRTLSVLVGPNAVLARHTLQEINIPLAAVKPLVEAVELYAFPTDLDRPPSTESCSRLASPITVRLSVTVIDLYDVDDVAMEYESSMHLYTSWDDDRILYIPSSTEAELEACKHPCFDEAENDIEAGESVPPEATRCCDRVWIPRITLTNAKELNVVEDAKIVWKRGSAFMQTTLRGRFKSSMFFHNFPFDAQDLLLSFQLANSIADVKLVIADVVVLQGKKETTPGWRLVDSGSTVREKNERGSDLRHGSAVSHLATGSATQSERARVVASDVLYSRIDVKLRVRRQHSHFVDNYVSSIVMLTTLSWVAFALTPSHIETRLAAVITLVCSTILYTSCFCCWVYGYIYGCVTINEASCRRRTVRHY
jgi:hypothetical protein